ncbi:MAG TPA: sulfotransferase [Fimbriimonadaceae bacterium]|jgi:tetratricopeptide (TPR) repeat protein
MPNLEQLLFAANEAQSNGRLEEAETLARQAMDLKPSHPQPRLLLSVVLCKREKFQDAEPILRKLLLTEGEQYDVVLWLANALRNLGRPREAIPFAHTAAKLKPDQSRAWFQLGLCLTDDGHFQDAAKALGRAISLEPKAAAFHLAYSKALRAQGLLEPAIEHLGKAFNQDPSSEPLLTELTDALLESGDSARGKAAAERLIELKPDSQIAKLQLARALLMHQKGEEALALAVEATEGAPNTSLSCLFMGQVLQALGRFKEAMEFFRKAIELNPTCGNAYAGLVHVQRITPNDQPLIDEIEARLEDTTYPGELFQMHYALGKSHQDLRQFEQAMHHYDEANRLEILYKFGGARFNKEAYGMSTNRLIASQTSSAPQLSEIANTSALPIFVVGMVRSGTTLTEQILSSHPDIGSAGEQHFWLEQLDRFDSLYPEQKAALAAEYIAKLQSFAPGKSRVVDKMPGNYVLASQLSALFSNATFIHVERNAVDNCLSIYTTPNSSRIVWGSKEDITFAYQEYHRLMKHIKKVLPEGRMLEVQYEDLVQDPERVSREMVEFAGLEWDDAVLRPEDNERTVVTPSSWQARQPVYKTSVERWRSYEPWLGAFRDLL